MQLTPAMERFILHWGEMGTRWGVNRSVAQIHALLYLSKQPLPAETIAEALALARSNVSTSLKELQGWGLISLTHVLGDRRDHYVALKDPQEIFNAVVEGRKRREIDPTLTLLRDVHLSLQEDKQADPEVARQIKAMLDFVELMSDWYEDMRKLPSPARLQLAKLGSKVMKWL
jgi:DNA-binding transcriptional regulator GbsR (MarR family)